MTPDRLAGIFGITVAIVVAILQVRTERDVAMIIVGAVLIAALQLLAATREEP